MRIAILYLGRGGGIAHCALELAAALADHARIECFVAAQNDLLDQFQSLPCEVHAFPMKRGPGAALFELIRNAQGRVIGRPILAFKPDLVLDVGSGVWGPFVRAGLIHKVPVATIVHDVSIHPDLRSFVDALPELIVPAIGDIVISLSAFSHRQLQRKYPGKKLIRSNLGVIMSSDSIDPIRVAAARHRQLFFGRVHPYKGLEVLVDAFHIAKPLMPSLQLDVVGPGTISRRLIRRMSDLGIGVVNRYVPEETLQLILAAHGVMILPYTSATQSAAAAVALGQGMPCIASKVGALPEQVANGTSGLIVPPGDAEALAQAMVTIAMDESMAVAMAAATLRLGREVYSWDAIAQKLLRDLQSVLRS